MKQLIRLRDYNNVSIVIPAYNEEEGIKDTLDELLGFDMISDMEIIVVNDGSSDSTNEILSNYNMIKIVQHKLNKGYGSSIVSGVKASTKSIVVWYDSDGQHSHVI